MIPNETLPTMHALSHTYSGTLASATDYGRVQLVLQAHHRLTDLDLNLPRTPLQGGGARIAALCRGGQGLHHTADVGEKDACRVACGVGVASTTRNGGVKRRKGGLDGNPYRGQVKPCHGHE